MKVLDRYLFSLVSKYFILGVLAFFALFSFIDLASRVFKFSASSDVFTAKNIALYYIYSLPELFQWTSPFILCLSCFFVFSRLQQNSQIVAIMAAGLPTMRLAHTLFKMAALLGLLIWVVNVYVAPQAAREKLKIDKAEIFGSKAEGIDANFRDRIVLVDDRFKKVLDYPRSLEFIDIVNIDFEHGKSDHFHATFFDQKHRPKHKLFARSTEIDRNNKVVILRHGYLFPYDNSQSFKDNFFDRLEIKINIPLEATLFAKDHLEALSNTELEFFMHRREAYVEFFYRYITPFNALFMLIISLSLGLSVLYVKPVNSYFICLVSCVLTFLLSMYFKNEAISGWISPITGGASLFSIALTIFITNAKRSFEM